MGWDFMFYYLFEYLHTHYDFPGAGVFRYISFRAAMAVIVSLLISMVFGKRIINLLHRKQVGETIRDLGLAGEKQKKGTPTMGGLIILSAIIIPTLLFAKLHNVYVILMLVATVWLPPLFSLFSTRLAWANGRADGATLNATMATRSLFMDVPPMRSCGCAPEYTAGCNLCA